MFVIFTTFSCIFRAQYLFAKNHYFLQIIIAYAYKKSSRPFRQTALCHRMFCIFFYMHNHSTNNISLSHRYISFNIDIFLLCINIFLDVFLLFLDILLFAIIYCFLNNKLRRLIEGNIYTSYILSDNTQHKKIQSSNEGSYRH